MKKQIIYLSAAMITGACLLFSSTATNLPVKASAAKDAGAVKNTCSKNASKQAAAPAVPVTTFPGIIYIEM